MSFVNYSANMSLPIPIPGQESGPQYALDVNDCLTLLDQHNHSPGSGVPINSGGLNITSDLSLHSNNLTDARTVRFQSQSGVLTLPSDLACLYAVGVDLYFNDGSGNNIRITQSGGVAGTPGSIGSLTLPASVNYASAFATFIFQSDINKAANLDVRSIILRNNTVSSYGMTLSPPSAMASDTVVTLPPLPASTSLLQMDSAGNITTLPATAIVPVGAAIPYAGSSIPGGFLLCDGSAVSRTTYATLFAAIGTTFGDGDGVNTFNLPDATGKLSFLAQGSFPSYVHSNWKMDAGGTEPNEVQPSGYNLSVFGTVGSAAGKINLCRGPFSSGNYLYWNGGGVLSVYDTKTFLVEGWFKTNVAANGTIVSKFRYLVGVSTQGWRVGVNAAGTLAFDIGNDTASYGVTSTGTYIDNQWHYFVAAQLALSGSTNMRLYVDNTLQGATDGHNMYQAISQNLTMGECVELPTPFQGYIDDIAYWDTVPSSWTEVESLMAIRWNSGAGRGYAANVDIPYIIKT